MSKITTFNKQLCILSILILLCSGMDLFVNDAFLLVTDQHTGNSSSEILKAENATHAEPMFVEEISTLRNIGTTTLREYRSNLNKDGIRISLLFLLMAIQLKNQIHLPHLVRQLAEECVKCRYFIIWYIHRKDGSLD